ncbi:MAG: GerMN domain-containing protein [Lachnospiraceae bacterium]|nr:GerMN domain-containing protein [Lachnospiraceae bacterium]
MDIRTKIKSFNIILCILGLLLAVSACGRAETVSGDGFMLYYVANSLTKTESREYELKNQDTEGEINEVISALSTKSEDISYVAPFSFFTLQGVEYNDRRLNLDMDNAYYDMAATTEVLVRACIVKSLVQIDGVDYVSFTVEGEQLYDNSGTPVGLMSADTFINNDGNEINTYELTRVKLYFANEDGDKLIAAFREKYYSTNTPLERFVVDELISGPSGQVPGLYPTINPAAKVASVSTRDGVCYVNLNIDTTLSAGNVSTELSVYSIVNSLAELPDVNKVQILINGEIPSTFSNTYERNLDNVTTLDQ